ncbi:E3 ubiquitin-protein ligase RGLG2-like [Papaver somniferum]|uniref:E3 ubiquitin-protein ligase RGLG2-like n=1 Tax=Papaver somniferum TaxID=3469 RepID=UPI000E6FD29C|nr:E3 ubiquitin-protein ligase RGLG2-like [Papaver somniferum]
MGNKLSRCFRFLADEYYFFIKIERIVADYTFGNLKPRIKVSEGLRELLNGESVNLIFGICFNRSQGWTVRENNLHYIDRKEKNNPNAYERAIAIIGRTINDIHADNQSIYCFGFGDATTHHLEIFRFSDEPCEGVDEALMQYRHAAKNARPTERVSYGPIIRKATCIAGEKRDQHHLLVILASETVSRSFDTKRGQLSLDEKNTYHVIKDARKFRFSIVLVGVGERQMTT